MFSVPEFHRKSMDIFKKCDIRCRKEYSVLETMVSSGYSYNAGHLIEVVTIKLYIIRRTS